LSRDGTLRENSSRSIISGAGMPAGCHSTRSVQLGGVHPWPPAGRGRGRRRRPRAV
jgi:hypothetical protein